MSKGKVYLVGAGPGDPMLLTLEAQRLIKLCDTVIYDRLVSKEIMELIPSSSKLIDVGKNVGDHLVPQEEINKILLEEAMMGNDVLRLKGGDPFLFGRGGEELELLIDNDIKFKVVPGITSAIAAPSYGGIPVTHRDFCSSVHIISGHTFKGGELPIKYEALSKLNGTLVFLMSVASMPRIARGLIEASMAEDTEVAFIENGTRGNQRRIVTTLGNLEIDMVRYKVVSPATVVVGRVCSLADRYGWAEKQPLFGKKILVTRPDRDKGELIDLLRIEGATVDSLPLIDTFAIDFDLDLDKVSTIAFTSPVGVRIFFAKIKADGKDARILFGKKIAVVGERTARELEVFGVKADFCPKAFSGESMANEMLESGFITKGDKVGIYRAAIGSEDIGDILHKNSIEFLDIPVYETKAISHEIDMDKYDMVTFTSASCVNNFVATIGEYVDFSKVKAVCIGNQTAQVANKYNMDVVVSKKATMASMVERIIENGN